ncbi:hypothetical protein [Nocardioides panzhihuensis]|uniref:Uncharacterized protein n=1 Tax=Nocardioides panzhihuensis TaxID=860243 RepID=A0A7Z0ITE1_9ACTN|nr:hypothetical protein [Nocardioides panzhihuensis]NYI78738.1 hypothetical protein [Nocardioides panzhihuensis]
MTTDAQIDDPIAEFAELPPDVQQSLLTITAATELMLPDERSEAAHMLLGAVAMLEQVDVGRITRLVLNEVGSLLVAADREERAADARAGL